MTRAEAEQALEIARNALREVGEDEHLVFLQGDAWYGGLTVVVDCADGDPRIDTVARAARIGVAAFHPERRVVCSAHFDRTHQWDCAGVPVTEALAGLSCEMVTS